MEQLKRAENPFRFHIPEDLIPKLRDLRGRQQAWREVVEAEDVVHLYYGLGPAEFLTFDGRILIDSEDWDGTGVYEVTDRKRACSAIVIGAKIWKFPELFRLLPPRPPNAIDCPQCKGKGVLFPLNAAGEDGWV